MNTKKMDYDYMRPPERAFTIIHRDEYIFNGNDSSARRNIFYNVQKTSFEKKKIKDLKERMEQASIKVILSEEEVLKYLYASKFNLDTCLKNLEKLQKWNQQMSDDFLSNEALDILREGLVYIAGRDFLLRPVIRLNLGRINLKKHKIENYQRAVIFVLDLAKKYCFIPGHIENWIILADLEGAGLFSFPKKSVKKLIEVLQVKYCASLESMFLVNPSSGLKLFFGLVSRFIDPVTREKIMMVTKKEYKKILTKHIPTEQLEARYGGKLPNPHAYWPAFTTLDEEPYTVTRELKRREEDKRNNSDYTSRDLSVQNDSSITPNVLLKKSTFENFVVEDNGSVFDAYPSTRAGEDILPSTDRNSERSSYVRQNSHTEFPRLQGISSNFYDNDNIKDQSGEQTAQFRGLQTVQEEPAESKTSFNDTPSKSTKGRTRNKTFSYRFTNDSEPHGANKEKSDEIVAENGGVWFGSCGYCKPAVQSKKITAQPSIEKDMQTISEVEDEEGAQCNIF